MKILFYFGCRRQAGHYLFEEGEKLVREDIKIPGVNPYLLRLSRVFFDGPFIPVNGSGYSESVIPPLRIICWADNSVDHRRGSHSTFIGYGYESGEEMLDEAVTKFPSVIKRQPRPKPNVPKQPAATAVERRSDFAILMLEDLKFHYFTARDELQNACSDLHNQGAAFLPLIRDVRLGLWSEPKVWS
jgi:hypothetical protein